MTRTVTVWDKSYKIDVERKSKSVWIASGEYMGQYIQTMGATDGAAMKRWMEAARAKGG